MTDQPDHDRYHEHLDAFGEALRRAALEHRALRPVVGRRSLALATGAVAALAVAVLAISAIGGGRTGTFVGEAGARELLRAAADASQGGAIPSGWRWSRSTSVDRTVLFGRPCATCPEERTVVESRLQRDTWTGAEGEAYVRQVRFPTRVLENEPLARAGGGLRSERHATESVDAFWWPPRDDRDPGVGPGLGGPGAIRDPAAVPAEPDALVRWVAATLEAQRRAIDERLKANTGRSDPTISEPLGPRAISGGLLDLAISAPIAAPQRAAALNALAEQPGVEVVPTPAVFRGDDHVAIRVTSVPGSPSTTAQRRTVVFDRTTHRIVGDYMAQAVRTSGPAGPPTISLGGTQRFRMAVGSGIRASYDGPVAVAGPGVGPDGARVLDPDEARRTGKVVGTDAVVRDPGAGGAPPKDAPTSE